MRRKDIRNHIMTMLDDGDAAVFNYVGADNLPPLAEVSLPAANVRWLKDTELDPTLGEIGVWVGRLEISVVDSAPKRNIVSMINGVDDAVDWVMSQFRADETLGGLALNAWCSEVLDMETDLSGKWAVKCCKIVATIRTVPGC